MEQLLVFHRRRTPIAASEDGSKVLLADYGFPEDVAVFDSASGTWSVNGNNGTGTILNNLGSNAAASFNASVLGTIEVKVPKGRQSDHQKAFQDAREAAEGRYVLAYSLEDMIRKV